MAPSVLRALDSARTQAYHFLAIVIAGMGFFTDAYDLFCISAVTKLLGRIYYYDPTSKKPGVLPIGVSSAVTGVALVGTLCGQLFFGWLGDKLGRKSVYGFTLLMMVGCAICQGLSFGHTATSVMVTLCFFRFWLGFGIGGDYPLSATIMAEYANTKTRGAFIGAVFAMQGVGILTAAAVALLVAGCFADATHSPTYAQDPAGSTPLEADWVWRIILMAGAVPAAITFYWRLKMPETARFTALVQRDAAQAAQDMGGVLKAEFVAEDAAVPMAPQYGLFSSEFRSRHMMHLIGASASWFFLDIAFYSQNLFQKDIFTAVGWLPKAANMSAIMEVYKIARAQALIALCGTVPGYWVTVFTVDWLGRKLIQIQGFFFMTIFMAVLAGEYNYFRNHSHIGFVVLYGLTFFFANFGPNATTFILPAELFPARLRSTCHGIAAASGKAGAIIGAFGFLYAAQPTDPTKTDAGYPTGIGIQWALGILAISNFLGLLSSFFVIETKQRSLEEISDEYEGGPYTLDSVTDGKAATAV